MGKNQIGYSLIFVETLKPYNEKTKKFEPLKIKRVEVCQELSEYFSNDEKAKNMMFDKMFDYKEDVKRLLDNNEYDEIPSYHKESLKKDQKIADLEAKLAEKEKEIEDLKQTKLLDDLHDASLTLLIGDKTRADLWALVEEHAMRELVLEERIKQEKNQTAIAELEKVKDKFGYKYNSQLMISSKGLCDYIDQQIKSLKGER